MIMAAKKIAEPVSEQGTTAESVWGPSAEVIPFPLRGQELLVGDICFQYGERRGRKQKRAYLDTVISSYRQRMERLAVAPERIDAEVAYLESIFAGDAA